MHDQLNVSGTAALDGALAVRQMGTGVPDVGERILVVQSGAGRIGTFNALVDPFVGNYAIHLETYYDDYNAYLDVIQDPYASFARTHNQRSVANWLDGFSGDPSVDHLVDVLNNIPGSQLPTVLDLIGPEEYGLLIDQGVGAANVFAGNLVQRMGQLRRGGVGGLSQNVLLFDPNRSLAENAQPSSMTTLSDASGSKTPVPTLAPPQGWGIFLMGNAQLIDIGDTHEAAGGDIQTGGITLGADAQVRNNLLMGVAFDYVNSEIDYSAAGKADVQGGKGSVFATWFDDSFHLDAALGGGFNTYDVRRAALDGNATGDTRGWEVDGMLGGGYDRQMGNFTLSPGASLYYTTIRIDGFTEDGSLAPLKIDSLDGSSLLSRLGTSLAYHGKIGSTPVKPEVGMYTGSMSSWTSSTAPTRVSRAVRAARSPSTMRRSAATAWQSRPA